MNKTTKNTGNTAPAQAAQDTPESRIYKLGLKVAKERESAIKSVLEDMQAISQEKTAPKLRDIRMKPASEAYQSALQDIVDQALNKANIEDLAGIEINKDAAFELHDRREYTNPKYSEQEIDRMIYSILKHVIVIAIPFIESAEDFIDFINNIDALSDLTYKDLMQDPKYKPVKKI